MQGEKRLTSFFSFLGAEKGIVFGGKKEGREEGSICTDRRLMTVIIYGFCVGRKNVISE